MDQDNLVQERKEKIKRFFKKNAFVSLFTMLGLISLFLSFFSPLFDKVLSPLGSKLGLPAGLSLLTIPFGGLQFDIAWFFLFCAFLFSAFISYNEKISYSFYPLLAWLIWLSIKLRTLNLPRLKDITTGEWTLGPDLDPFLVLRWAKYIVAHGELMLLDNMRYIPLGFDTSGELVLWPYSLAWFHKLASIFGSISVTHSAVLFPVFMFALTVIAFFFLARVLFTPSLGKIKASIIACIGSFFLIVIPSLLPRTIAGIPEKESAGFFFLFLALLFYVISWRKESFSRYVYALISGILTASMALIWGGYIYIFLTISLSILVSFFLSQVSRERIISFSIWLFSSIAFILPFTTRYSLKGFIVSASTGIAFFVLALLLVNEIIFNTRAKEYFSSWSNKIPSQIISLIMTILILAILSTLFFGFSFIPSTYKNIMANLVVPVTDRLGVTVAENKQPYFNEWGGSFGPNIGNIPIFFTIVFFSSIFLLRFLISSFERKEKMFMTLAYTYFLFAIIFSRYKPDSLFNGTNTFSLLFYASGFMVLLFTFGYYYFKHTKLNTELLKSLDFNLIFLFAFFFFSIISARGAYRLIMVLVPSAALIASFALVRSFSYTLSLEKEKRMLALSGSIIFALLISYNGYVFFIGSEQTSLGYAPSEYSQQWQKAMAWVRGNTPQNSVFGHWWDYGYWVQSIGERATVLDGGNAIPYWNYLMGRYGLTGTSSEQAIDFLYSHNTTHFLIDSSDIGKYGAFSRIGSDKNYDRVSFIQPLLKENKKIESKNGTIYFYSSGNGVPLDSDIIHNLNGTNIFLPQGKSGLAGIMIELGNDGEILKAPIGIYVDQKGKRYDLPLRYAYNKRLVDFGQGIEAGVFIMPRASNNQFDSTGALLYLSNRTVKSQLARLYLYNEPDPYFRLAHTEEDFVVKQVQNLNLSQSQFLYYEGFRGPIRIWEISYPSEMQTKEEYTRTTYPDPGLLFA